MATQEAFVYRRDEEAALLRERFLRCRTLYGSEARVDGGGTILFPTWRRVRRGEAGVGQFVVLSRKRVSDVVYLRRGLPSKAVHELRINEVHDDGGSVEAAIRAMDCILEGEREREKGQAAMVLRRAGFLLAFFREHRIADLSREEREELTRETARLLAEAELDPERVILEEKQKMARWVVKASLGEDSRGRINPLITTMSLLAAQRRAVAREIGVGGHIIPKFLKMREAMAFAREFDRTLLAEVGTHLEILPSTVYVRRPEYSDAGLTYTTQHIDHLSFLFRQTKVRPYRPVALTLLPVFDEMHRLFLEGQREEIAERGLLEQFAQGKEKIAETLERYANIYPTDS